MISSIMRKTLFENTFGSISLGAEKLAHFCCKEIILDFEMKRLK